MKRLSSAISMLLFLSILIVPSLLWGVKKVIRSDVWEVQLDENRELAKWPQKFSSDVPSEVEDYYNDHLPFRSVMLRAYSVCDGDLEGFYRDTLQPKLVALSGRSGNSEYDSLTEKFNDQSGVPETSERKVTKPKKKSNAYKETDSREPTCTEAGYVTFARADGSNEYTEEIPALGHKYVDDGVVEPTYLRYGFRQYRCERCGRLYKADFTEKLIDDSYLPESYARGRVLFGRFRWLFYTGDNALSYYTGSNVMSEELMRIRLDEMKELKDICEAQGKTIIFAVWPNKEQVYPEYMPTYEIENPLKRELTFKAYVEANSDVTFLYPVEDLSVGKVLGDTYYPYDTHWNTWGSYLGVASLYHALGYETGDYQDLQIMEIPGGTKGLVGTGLLNDEDYQDDYDYQVIYRPGVYPLWTDGERDLNTGYSDVYRAEATEPLYDKHIVLIGDSFRVQMLAYMEKDFRRTVGVSRKYMEWGAEEIRNADIIVVSAVERFDDELYAKLPELKTYLTQSSE